MRVYLNFREVKGPYGGANAFLRALRRALVERGVGVAADPAEPVDLVFLNALTQDIDLPYVQRLAEKGVPIVHRKVGYRVSGPPELRRKVDGVVWGDKLQLDFTPYLAHTIFQSAYSRDVFVSEGFAGPCSVIHNGVDETVFNLSPRQSLLRRSRARSWWDGSEPFRLVVSTWSTDENKGFPEYRRIDAQLAGRSDVAVTLVGRVPPGTTFRHVEVLRPRVPRGLAAVLGRAHGLLQLARHETCSNALIEGINCGLPVIYEDSGSNAELAAPYGVPYEGDLDAAVARLQAHYAEIVARIPENPYRVSHVGQSYVELFERVLAERAA